MKMDDLAGKKIVIWGIGREGLAAYTLIRKHHPRIPITFIDENAAATLPPEIDAKIVINNIFKELNKADVIIKSPGVSLYHPEIIAAKKRGVFVTSLMSLWFSLPRKTKTICVTGTKGKSTTSSLLAHVLRGMGYETCLAGNIGQAIGTQENDDTEYLIIEMSSYQTADFQGVCDVSVLTSLYPEHLDWHQSLEQYYRDKTRLLQQAKTRIVNTQCFNVLDNLGIDISPCTIANAPESFHVQNDRLYNGENALPDLENAYLCRTHNLLNVCAVLAVIQSLGFDPLAALRAMDDFHGLPHRQQELGTKNGVLYVDDSISTTPQTAIFAMENYKNRPISIIVGGQDRGIDYTPLLQYISAHNIYTVICMGQSGQTIFNTLAKEKQTNLFMAQTMEEAVRFAIKHTPDNGVILLSPAAPSYGLFKNFIERGHAFAKLCGF